MSFYKPREIGSGTAPLNPKLSAWRKSVEQGARSAYQKEQAAKKLTRSSGVGKPYVAQMTFRKMFGKAQSEYSIWLKRQSEVIAWKNKWPKGSVKTLSQKKQKMSEIGEILPELKRKFVAGGGSAHKHYNSAKSIREMAKLNGITSVSKAAINMIKMLDGTSAEALISWHKQKYGSRPNLPEAEVMAFLKDQVVPHIGTAVQREEALQKKVQKSHLTGAVNYISTEPVDNWVARPKTGLRPKYTERKTLRGMSHQRPEYQPVKGPNYGTGTYYEGVGQDLDQLMEEEIEILKEEIEILKEEKAQAPNENAYEQAARQQKSLQQKLEAAVRNQSKLKQQQRAISRSSGVAKKQLSKPGGMR